MKSLLNATQHQIRRNLTLLNPGVMQSKTPFDAQIICRNIHSAETALKNEDGFAILAALRRMTDDHLQYFSY